MRTILSKGPLLDLPIEKDTVGNYLCIAKVNGIPEISKTVGLFMKVRPILAINAALCLAESALYT